MTFLVIPHCRTTTASTSHVRSTDRSAGRMLSRMSRRMFRNTAQGRLFCRHKETAPAHHLPCSRGHASGVCHCPLIAVLCHLDSTPGTHPAPFVSPSRKVMPRLRGLPRPFPCLSLPLRKQPLPSPARTRAPFPARGQAAILPPRVIPHFPHFRIVRIVRHLPSPLHPNTTDCFP